MKRKYIISKEEAEEIKEYRKTVTDKYTDRRLYAVQMIGEGIKVKDIAEKLDADRRQISMWAEKFCTGGGIKALDGHKGGRHHENLTYEEEVRFLEEFKEKAEKGQIVEVSEIRKKYNELVGRETNPGNIYPILHRHGWSKKMPRSKHPNKASDEAVKASKKLNQK